MLKTDEILMHLKRYKEQKQAQYHIRKIGLFGSFAQGKAEQKSDIDVVVDFEQADLYNQISIMQELEELFGTQVDVIALWKHMNPKLLSRIQKDAIYV